MTAVAVNDYLAFATRVIVTGGKGEKKDHCIIVSLELKSFSDETRSKYIAKIFNDQDTFEWIK